MRLQLVLVLFLLATLASAPVCREPEPSAKDITLTLDSLESKFVRLNFRLAQENWLLLTTGQADSLEFYRGLYDWVVGDESAFDRLRAGVKQAQNETDQRRLALLYPMFLRSHVEQSRQVRAARDSLVDLMSSYAPMMDGEARTPASLAGTLRYDAERADREKAYRALHSVGDEAGALLSRLFRLRNQQARGLGYNNFFGMILSATELTLDGYVALLETLDSATVEEYAGLTDQVRRSLSSIEIEIWDVPYAYSSVFREVDRYFPVDSQLNYIHRGFQDIGFFLNKLPIYFDTKTLEGEIPSAVALTIKAPFDQRVAYTPSGGLAACRMTAEQIGKALRTAFINEPRALYSSICDEIWTGAMARVFADIFGQDQWLGRYASVPGELIARYRRARHQQDLVELRLTLLQLSFEYEAYQNPNRDLNRLYWDLFEKYMLLPRHDDMRPWAATIEYVTRPAQSHHDLLADMISAQTLAYIEKYQGSVVANPETKAFLVQNYFRFGSRFPWNDLLQRGTGEPLQPRYLLERLGI
ncbi:MAG TPA: M3 family metallopeptidase [Acidobacteriota bacterium]|nr:M3 family metallopeptidase [Acidobacteriota bacterium]